MTDIPPKPADRISPLPRTVRRILLEAFFVFLLAAMVFGVIWELGHPEIGWVVAVIICAAGAPLLEIIRMAQHPK